jgi:hypothetical protein
LKEFDKENCLSDCDYYDCANGCCRFSVPGFYTIEDESYRLGFCPVLASEKREVNKIVL